MKKALGKPSDTLEEDLQRSDEVPGTQLDSTFLEKQFKSKKSIPAKKELEFLEKLEPETENKTKINVALPERKFKSVSPKENRDSNKTTRDFFTPPNSQPENIPVIKISKTESDEHLLKEGCGTLKGKDAKEGKIKFIKAVEKFIKMKRKEMQTSKQDSEKNERKTVVDEEKNAETETPAKSTEITNGMEEKSKENNDDDNDDDDENKKKCPIAKEEIIPSELNFSAEIEQNNKN